MAQLTTFAFVGSCLAGVSAAEEFSARDYFCENSPATLSDYAEAAGAAAFLRDLRTAASDLDPVACPGLRLQTAIMIANMEDPLMVSTSILATTRANLGRQMQIVAPEPRYAGDMDILLQLALTCALTGAGDDGCVVGTIRGLPVAFLQTLPVFCDFAPASEATIDGTDLPGFADSLPLLCGAFRPGTSWRGEEDWVAQAARWGIDTLASSDEEADQDGD